MDFSYKFYRTTGDAWDAMRQTLLSATKSIFWEVYIFIDDTVGARFVEILCEKAKAGVDVKLVLDSMGSFSISSLSLARLRGAGAEVLWYNKLHPELHLGKWFRRIWKRNHRKVLIVDENVAFLGGVNVSAKFGAWYDIYLRLTGKIVRPLLKGFAKTYTHSGGEKEKVRHLLHPKITELEGWKDRFKYFLSSPIYTRFSPLRRLYISGLAMAKESFNLLTPYYVPDKEFLQLISKAKNRGVKVNLFLPARPDYVVLDWIARAYYELTHKAGANIYLLDKMNHGKAMTVDNKAGFVGSANFTPRSFFDNEEAGVHFSDEQMVADLNNILESWKEEATPFNLEEWKKRGWRNKFKEWWGKRFERFM